MCVLLQVGNIVLARVRFRSTILAMPELAY